MDEKLSYKQIAGKIGVTSATVGNWVKKFGFPRRNISTATKLAMESMGFRIEIPREKISQLYWDKKLSRRQIAKFFGVHPAVIQQRMNEFNIPARSTQESIHNSYSQGRVAWNKGKKGVCGGWNKGIHLSEEVRKRMSLAQKGKKIPERIKRWLSITRKGKHFSPRTELTSERAKSLWKDPTIRKKMREGISKSKMGKPRSEELREKIRRFRKTQKIPTSRTKPELRFMGMCEKYDLPFRYTGDSSFWIGRINPDFVGTNGKKIAVDIFGDYWHNPSLKKNVPWYAREANRKAIAKGEGWDLVIIWESELKNENLVLDKVTKSLWNSFATYAQ